MMMKGQQQGRLLFLLLSLLLTFLHNNPASGFVLPQHTKKGTTSTSSASGAGARRIKTTTTATSLFVVVKATTSSSSLSSSSDDDDDDDDEFVNENNNNNNNNNNNKILLPLTDTTNINNINRRRSLLLLSVITSSASLASFQQPAIADETTTNKGKGKGKKIVVFGGSGYVGSYVIDLLIKQGYYDDVTSVSRSSIDIQKSKIINNLGSLPLNVKFVSLDASKDDFGTVLNDASAVISCIGVIGGTNQRNGNGAVNIRIATASKKANVSRIVYIGLASDLANGPAKFILGDYIKGKSEGEAAILKEYGSESSKSESSSSYLIVKPSIIAGSPPGEIRPPGPPGVTPVQVEAVAKAVVAGATGAMTGIIDGNTEISKLI